MLALRAINREYHGSFTKNSKTITVAQPARLKNGTPPLPPAPDRWTEACEKEFSPIHGHEASSPAMFDCHLSPLSPFLVSSPKWQSKKKLANFDSKFIPLKWVEVDFLKITQFLLLTPPETQCFSYFYHRITDTIIVSSGQPDKLNKHEIVKCASHSPLLLGVFAMVVRAMFQLHLIRWQLVRLIYKWQTRKFHDWRRKESLGRNGSSRMPLSQGAGQVLKRNGRNLSCMEFLLTD